MDLERQVVILEQRTEALFGKEVTPEAVGEILVQATRLWLRQCLVDDWPVVEIDRHIEHFPYSLLYRLENVIETLEMAFEGSLYDPDEADRLLKKNKVRIDEWFRPQLNESHQRNA